MKGKKLKIILIVSTIVIWGLIAYRLIDFFQKPKLPNTIAENGDVRLVEVLAKDTFAIQANYNDPFLGRAAANKPVAQNANKNVIVNQYTSNKNSQVNTDKKDIIWPLIVYKGQIYNTNTKKQTGMLTINNTETLVTKGEVFKEVMIDLISSDSIMLIYKNNKKTFYKTN